MLAESTGPTSPPPRVVEGGQGANLPELLTFLIAARRLILSITAAVVVAGLLYAKIATPIYRSDTLIQVEEKKKGIAGLEDLNALMPSDNAADAEIEITSFSAGRRGNRSCSSRVGRRACAALASLLRLGRRAPRRRSPRDPGGA